MDRTKLDPHVATLVVVEVVTEPSGRTRYRLACDAGVITTVYNRGDIRLLPRSMLELHGLRVELEGWRGLPKVGIRAAMRALSRVTNGQGMRRCSCTGTSLKGKSHAGKLASSATPGVTQGIRSAATTWRNRSPNPTTMSPCSPR